MMNFLERNAFTLWKDTMGTKDKSHHASNALELAYTSFAVFADDGAIDMEELNFLLGIALRDGKISDDERDILANVFNRIQEGDVSAKVWSRIQEVRRVHSI
jgi:hypothetical protein